MWLGREVSSEEVLIGVSTGVFRVRSVRRLPQDQKFNLNLLQSFKTVPWNHRNDGRFYPQFILPSSSHRLQAAPPLSKPPDEQANEGEVRDDPHPVRQVDDELQLQPAPPSGSEVSTGAENTSAASEARDVSMDVQPASSSTDVQQRGVSRALEDPSEEDDRSKFQCLPEQTGEVRKEPERDDDEPSPVRRRVGFIAQISSNLGLMGKYRLPG